MFRNTHGVESLKLHINEAPNHDKRVDIEMDAVANEPLTVD